LTSNGLPAARHNIDTIKENTQTLFDAGNEVGLEVNTEKTKYMLLYRQQNAWQNHDIKTGIRCFEIVAQFRYLGTTITNKILVGKPEGKRPLGKPRRRLVDNMKWILER
jgi:hypothetical protein